MNRELQNYLEQIIKTEYVSVHHDYDSMETNYTIPYNAALAPQSVKIMLMQTDGILDDGEVLDDEDDINLLAENLTDYMTPEFMLSTTHYINNKNKLMTQYSLDFNGTVLSKKICQNDKINARNPLFKLIKMCSNKIILQELIAQKSKMEKMFVSTNMFKIYAQRGKM